MPKVLSSACHYQHKCNGRNKPKQWKSSNINPCLLSLTALRSIFVGAEAAPVLGGGGMQRTEDSNNIFGQPHTVIHDSGNQILNPLNPVSVLV